MDDFLVPVKTTRSSANDTEQPAIPKEPPSKLDSVPDVIHLLKHEPDFASVERAVRFLGKPNPQVDIKIPSPAATPIVHLLVSDVLPNYWEQIFEDESAKKLAKATLRCLRSIPALGAIVARLRMFATESGAKDQQGKGFLVSRTTRLIQLLERILAADTVLLEISAHIEECGGSDTQKRLLWKELVAITASGKLVSVVSEAEDSIKLLGDYQGRSWIGVGQEYGAWSGRNVAEFASHMPEERIDSVCAQLISKSLSLGYTGKAASFYVKLTSQMHLYRAFSLPLGAAKEPESRRWWKSCANCASLRPARL
jgi:telomere length regulation protein